MIDDATLSAIKARLAKATPGRWVSYIEGRDHMSGSDFIMTDGEDIYLSGATHDDQDFIANARRDIELLVAEVERLRGKPA